MKKIERGERILYNVMDIENGYVQIIKENLEEEKDEEKEVQIIEEE